ncbi:MAG: hypothetical protein ABI728_03345 [Betaproteobacteria bacterium]
MPGLTLDMARLCLDRAMARARQEFNRPICVAVCDPLLTALPGGSVLKDESGTIVAAIGVSGLTCAEDQLVTDFIAEFVLSGYKP